MGFVSNPSSPFAYDISVLMTSIASNNLPFSIFSKSTTMSILVRFELSIIYRLN